MTDTTLAAPAVLRPAKSADCERIVQLITELAIVEEMEDQVKITAETLVKDGFESDPPFYHLIVAESDGVIVGYALYFYCYSVDNGGEYLYLEDLLVTESHRGKGVGKMMLKRITEVARERDCFCVQWCVLNYNTKAIEFYKHAGAFDLTLKENCHMYRINKDQFKAYLTTE